ncbi:MAG: cupin domain-containing protein [Solirubrobacteraceae bacterium]
MDPNLDQPRFDDDRDHPGFVARRARLGRQAGARRLGLSLFELPPGQAAYPYHVHLGEEEVLVALGAGLRLRTPDGWRELASGEVVAFLPGPEGAHQIVNPTDDTVRFLALSTNGEPDIVLYPDQDKVGVADRHPDGDRFREFFRVGDAVGYWEGIEAPAAIRSRDADARARPAARRD